MTLRRVIAVALGLAGLAGSMFAGVADVPKLPPAVGRNVDFVRDVRPLFEEHCYTCHGAEKQKSGYRLDVRGSAMKGGDVGDRPIVPGDSAHSPLIQYVAGVHPEITMPPKGEPLSAAQIGILRAWIDQGARWPADADKIKVADKSDWWSFRPIVRPSVPEGAANPIDAFVLAKLREKHLAPNPAADRRTLIRRVYFDLLGLPPSPEEVEGFVKDPDATAYEKLVDRLLDSPRYGERWGRHWLDAVRYGDTHGYDKDKVRENAWPYRDYVIRAFNSDKPYDRFVREQLAGDAFYPGTTDGVVGLGFIAAGPWDYVGQVELREGTIDKTITRNLDRDDMVTVTMNTFTSLTAQCARCHDHKFDPIRQEDYYSLQAVFAGVDRADRPYQPSDDVAARRKTLESKLDALKARRNQIDRSIARSAGPELAALDAKLAEATAAGASGAARPEYGYHSQVSPRQDAVKWVQVDLGRSTAIERILLAGCDDNFNNIGAGFGFPLRYRVEICDDPQFHRNVSVVADRTSADAANPGTRPQVIDAGGKPARYVRVTATKLAPRKDDFIFALAELVVLTPAGVDVARAKEVAALDSIEAPVRWRKSNLVDGYYPGQAQKVSATELAQLTRQRQTLLDKATDDATRLGLDRITKETSAVESQLKALPPVGIVYAAASEFAPQGSFAPTHGKPRPVYLLHRGSEKSPGAEVGPGTVAFAHVPALASRFAILPQQGEAARRAALADWIVDPRNPLTWRSIVNRVWQEHFGRGIVETPNDFGHMGALPSHPKLLDWLACEFRDGGRFLRPRSIKQLHRLILTSDTYRRSCADIPANAEIDGGNQYLWRMNRTRLDAEAVRDSILALAGQLDLTMGGPGFRDFDFKDDHSPHYTYTGYDPDAPGTHRRSVYRMIVRSVPDPFMETLDCADPSQIVARRNETLTPLQALALLNDPFVVRMTEHFAQRLRNGGDDLSRQIDTACRLAFGRHATDLERRTLMTLAQTHGLASACRVILNANAFIFVD
jgi:hypothetical protein